MYDPLKNDIVTTISRLELVHGELRTRYERAKEDYECANARLMASIDEYEQAKKDYALIERALKAMDKLRDGDEPDEDDCYF